MLYCNNRGTTSCCFENEKCEKNNTSINNKVSKLEIKNSIRYLMINRKDPGKGIVNLTVQTEANNLICPISDVL